MDGKNGNQYDHQESDPEKDLHGFRLLSFQTKKEVYKEEKNSVKESLANEEML